MKNKPKINGLDRVDITLKKWTKEKPKLNTSAKAIIGRVIRLQGVMLAGITELFKKFKINPSEYAVLCNLRIHGKPYQMTPKEIIQSVLFSSGGMSNLLERMEEKELIRRIMDPQDRRGVLVQLTAQGKTIIDAAMAAHVEIEEQFLAVLDKNERKSLTNMLKKLLTHLDPV